MVERLKFWEKLNKKCRKQFVVYRDGVSEGEYSAMIEKESPEIKRAIEKVFRGEPYSHNIAFIAATKRHHARFLDLESEIPPTQGPRKSDDKCPFNKNLASGTVVDKRITINGIWDFYLQSHDSPLRTAKNTRYVVLHNGNEDLTADGVQRMVSSPSHAPT